MTGHPHDRAAAAGRPVYLLRLRAEKNINPIRALRGLLKLALRRFGLRVLDLREERRP